MKQNIQSLHHATASQSESQGSSRRKPSAATRIARLPESLNMRRGGVLQSVDVAYETWGTLSPERDNAVLLFTGLSPSAHAASSAADSASGWWEFMIGPDRPIDTERFFVICVNSLGSCFGSTGPDSINPASGEPYRLDFPALSVEDIAAAGRAALRTLGIERLKAVVGTSLGGMTALAYAVAYPAEVENFVSICGAARANPLAIAIRSLQREIIRNDPVWDDGNYPSDQEPVEGMRLARKLGLISYRSGDEWEQRFGRDTMENVGESGPFGVEFQVESYLEANASKFVGSFDANAYLYLSRAMDWFDISEHGGSMAAAFGRIQARRSLVIGVKSDTLFPIAQQQEIADELQKAGREVVFHALDSIQGHDAFLVDKGRFMPPLADFFSAL